MAKHKLRVVKQDWIVDGDGVHPPEKVIVKCENCSKYLMIERDVMIAILCEKDTRLEIESKPFEQWRKCESFFFPLPEYDPGDRTHFRGW